MRIGNTIPQTMPKAARGDAVPGYKASRLGTIRFSVVLMPAFRSSASANGTAVPRSRDRMGILSPGAGYLLRKNIRLVNVSTAPQPLPITTD